MAAHSSKHWRMIDMTTDKIGSYIRKGSRDRHWYAQTEELFVDIFGRDRLFLVTQLFAATSIKTSLPANIRLFRRALMEIETGLPFSNYLPAMLFQLELIRKGEPINARKIRNFAAAMSGDSGAVVVDRWIMRAYGLDGDKSPTTKEYDRIEELVKYAADVRGEEPRQTCAMIWSGIRGGVTRYDLILRNQMYNMYESV
jgi:hypothetical protein